MEVCPNANMAAPRSRSDNTSTVSWITQEASTISPVVADLLLIRARHSRLKKTSVFYHLGQENRTADDASCLFEISDTLFLAHMSATYLQPQIYW